MFMIGMSSLKGKIMFSYIWVNMIFRKDGKKSGFPNAKTSIEKNNKKVKLKFDIRSSVLYPAIFLK